MDASAAVQRFLAPTIVSKGDLPMTVMEMFNVSDDWQTHHTAPDDGTPILVDEAGTIGIFAWEERSEVLGLDPNGEPNPPGWVGVYITTEFRPAMQGRAPLPDRFIFSHSLETPFLWRPLPARRVSSSSED